MFVKPREHKLFRRLGGTLAVQKEENLRKVEA
jgi:hypothetical protein